MSDPSISPPVADIAECRASQERLHAVLPDLDDAAVRQPTRLPGWTVGHVLSHLARNADSVVRRLNAAIDGRTIEAYEGGPAGRAAEIEAGATRPAGEMVADLIRADKEVVRAFESAPDSVWGHTVFVSGGAQGPAAQMVFARWREVETHHVDLDVGYQPADWPQTLVDRWLPSLLDGLSGRSDQKALMAWALGRGPAPDLAPWG